VKPASIFKSGLTLGFNQGFSQACAFLRNVIIARLLSPSDFGIASTFAITFFLIEMVSSLAADKLLIQAKDGDDPQFQNTVQLVLAWRGLMNAVLLFLLAGPISYLFGVPGARWAFRCLAIVPLIKGFTHLDPNRLQREMKFRPAVAVDVTSNILVTLAALPLGLWLRSYELMLWVLVAQAACSVILSHFVAERRYGWAWDARYLKQIFTFGWPLLINGLLMYVIFQGDRFVIGAAPRLFGKSPYTLADLGVYSVAFSLAMGPAMLVSNVSVSLFLPLLSRVQERRDQFERRYCVCAEVGSLVAALISIPLIVAGGWLVILIYGAKYAAAADFIGWVAAMWALRVLRAAPSVAAMARGDTRNAMVSNLVRSLALVGVLSVAAAGLPLSWIAACGFFGELLALAVNVGRLQRRHLVPAVLCLKPSLVCASGMALAALAVFSGVPARGWVATLLVSSGIMMTVFLGMVYAFPRLRQDIRTIVSGPESSSIAP